MFEVCLQNVFLLRHVDQVQSLCTATFAGTFFNYRYAFVVQSDSVIYESQKCGLGNHMLMYEVVCTLLTVLRHGMGGKAIQKGLLVKLLS